jgi:hypothetical protein
MAPLRLQGSPMSAQNSSVRVLNSPVPAQN